MYLYAVVPEHHAYRFALIDVPLAVWCPIKSLNSFGAQKCLVKAGRALVSYLLRLRPSRAGDCRCFAWLARNAGELTAVTALAQLLRSEDGLP